VALPHVKRWWIAAMASDMRLIFIFIIIIIIIIIRKDKFILPWPNGCTQVDQTCI